MQQRTAETQHQNPETTETRATLSSLTEKTGNNRRETNTQRGGEYMSTVRYQSGRWDGKQKKQEGNKKGEEFA
jgi:uncharacterized protein YkuJ